MNDINERSRPATTDTDAAQRPQDDASATHAAAIPPSTGKGYRTGALALAAVAVALLAVGIVPRLRAHAALTSQTDSQNTVDVSVVTPKPAPEFQELILPGAMMPYADASIYARTSGYIAHWNTDIGTHVKAGQLLALIAAPDLDAQLRQARADEDAAQANFDYSTVTAKRWQAMLKTQSVAQQDTDTKVSDMEAKRAMLASAQANVAHLAELVSYEKVVAPFDGTVTARNIDVGAIVTAGGTPGTPGMSGELFHIEQTDTLRVFVDVPENNAPAVVAGTPAYLTVQQYPGRRFTAHVARTTGTINPVNRTLRVEVDVDNRDGALLPGGYAQVHLALRDVVPTLDVPVSALLFRPNGVVVATVDPQGRTQLKTVHLGRDFGTHIEITSGLEPTDRVINNPGDAISDGELVSVVPVASPAAMPASAPAPASASHQS